MSPAARVAGLHLRRTPRRIAATWIAWAHDFDRKQIPGPLRELLREMRNEILDSDWYPAPGRRKHAHGEDRIVLAANFQCFVLIDLYSQLFFWLMSEMTSSLTVISAVFSYTDLERATDPELAATLQERRREFSTALEVLDLIEAEYLRTPVFPRHLRQMVNALRPAFELAGDLLKPDNRPASIAPSGKARAELETLLYRAQKVASDKNSDRNLLLIVQAECALRDAVCDYLGSLRLCLKKAIRRFGPLRDHVKNSRPHAARIRNRDRLLQCFLTMQTALLATRDKAE